MTEQNNNTRFERFLDDSGLRSEWEIFRANSIKARAILDKPAPAGELEEVVRLAQGIMWCLKNSVKFCFLEDRMHEPNNCEVGDHILKDFTGLTAKHADLIEQTRWRSVEEEMPKLNTLVETFHPQKGLRYLKYFGEYRGDSRKWDWECPRKAKRIFTKPTHWRYPTPLPEPPEKNK